MGTFDEAVIPVSHELQQHIDRANALLAISMAGRRNGKSLKGECEMQPVVVTFKGLLAKTKELKAARGNGKSQTEFKKMMKKEFGVDIDV